MSIEVRVPPVGESVTEATVVRWFKTVGETVTADEPLVELETDKVTVEVLAPVAGTLLEVIAVAGKIVAVGAVLGVIATIGVNTGAPVPLPSPPLPGPLSTPPLSPLAEHLSPAVRRMVTEQNLTPSVIPATGRGGRLTKEDVITFQETRLSTMPADSVTAAPAPLPAAPAAGRGEERVRMTRLRQRIAARLKEAQNAAAMLTTFNEVDMTAVITLRDRHREGFEKKYAVRLGFMSFFTKACVAALKAFPAVNAEIDGEEIVYKNYCHIGVAVGTAQGLVVPVVRDADCKSFAAIEAEITALGHLGHAGRLTVADLSGGTFTITNGGIYGSLMSTPILNPPQSGILGMHKIQQRPVVLADGSVAARPMMYVALSYDHRIIDGREAVSFLIQVKECLEDPARLLLEV